MPFTGTYLQLCSTFNICLCTDYVCMNINGADMVCAGPLVDETKVVGIYYRLLSCKFTKSISPHTCTVYISLALC